MTAICQPQLAFLGHAPWSSRAQRWHFSSAGTQTQELHEHPGVDPSSYGNTATMTDDVYDYVCEYDGYPSEIGEEEVDKSRRMRLQRRGITVKRKV